MDIARAIIICMKKRPRKRDRIQKRVEGCFYGLIGAKYREHTITKLEMKKAWKRADNASK
jgi:hypothetical protein